MLSGPERFAREIALLVGAYRNASAALQRLLLRLVDSFDSSTPETPEKASREAESGISGVVEVLRQAVREWTSTVAPKMYIAGARDAGSEDLSREQRTSMQLQISDLAARLLSATEAMREDALGKLREIARRRLQALMRGEEGIGKSIVEFREELRETGITLKNRQGRKIKPEDYADMALRTASANLLNNGTLETGMQLGAPAVQVFDGDYDEECQKSNGQVWSLEYAAAHLIEHPRCVRSFALKPTNWEGEIDRGSFGSGGSGGGSDDGSRGPGDSGGPNHEWFRRGTIAPDKFEKYLFDPDHRDNKGKADGWLKIFGYTFGDASEAAREIRKQLDRAKIIEQPPKGRYRRWELVIPDFVGKNGNVAPLVTAWALDPNNEYPHLSTAIPQSR